MLHLPHFVAGHAWTPRDLDADLELWLDASDYSTITESGGAVSQWNDKSGKGRNVSQSTADNKPTYSATGWNGAQPSISFDGSNDTLNGSDTFDSSSTWSLFAVLDDQYSAGNDYLLTLGGSGVEQRFVIGEGSHNLLYYNATNGAGSSIAGATGEQMFEWLVSTGIVMLRNGTVVSLQFGYNCSSISSAGTFAVGSQGSANYFQGEISELVLVSASLSDTKRRILEGYLAWKWSGLL